MNISMKWISEDRDTIAYIVDGVFYMNRAYGSVSKEDQAKIKTIKPLKTPKMPKTIVALNNYKAYIAEGYDDIRTPSMDSKISSMESRKESIVVEKIVDIKADLPVVLEVDAILEKIFKYGVSSITTEEKNFLDNQ
jgi:hypothetical protein